MQPVSAFLLNRSSDLRDHAGLGELRLGRATAAGDPGAVETTGITGVTPADIATASKAGKVIKLIGSARHAENGLVVKVAPEALSADHPLAGVNLSEKGISYDTDTMGRITTTGGHSSPTGAAAIVAELIRTLVVMLLHPFLHLSSHILYVIQSVPVKDRTHLNCLGSGQDLFYHGHSAMNPGGGSQVQLVHLGRNDPYPAQGIPELRRGTQNFCGTEAKIIGIDIRGIETIK